MSNKQSGQKNGLKNPFIISFFLGVPLLQKAVSGIPLVSFVRASQKDTASSDRSEPSRRENLDYKKPIGRFVKKIFYIW
jgi:hypothetical protein